MQMGSGRACWYSIDWIDNRGVPSSEEILPALQKLDAGDMIPFTQDGKFGLWVKDQRPPEWTLWWDGKGSATWLWHLIPADEGSTTRLVTRLRVRYRWMAPWIIYYLIQDIGDIVMMRKCMLGIKRRAERLAATSSPRSQHR